VRILQEIKQSAFAVLEKSKQRVVTCARLRSIQTRTHRQSKLRLMGALVARETPSCKNTAASNQHFQKKSRSGSDPVTPGLALRLPES